MNQEMKMNKQMAEMFLNEGEISAILNNIELANSGKYNNKGNSIKNNAIFLVKNKNILLRSNGFIYYGYYDGTNSGNFSVSNKERYSFSHNYIEYKNNIYVQEILRGEEGRRKKAQIYNAYMAIKTREVSMKHYAVRYVLSYSHLFRNEPNKVYLEKKSGHEIPAIKNVEVMNNMEKNKLTNEIKVDSKLNMKENIDMNVMTIAHIIRKGLKLEGAYTAQMSYALKLAWEVKKGIKDLNNILGKVATDATYNVAKNETVVKVPEKEEVDKTDTKIVSKTEKTTEEVIESSSDSSIMYEAYLVQEKGHCVVECKHLQTGKAIRLNGKVNSPIISAAYVFLDARRLPSLVKALPNNTRLTVSNNVMTLRHSQECKPLMMLCAEKNIELVAYTPVRNRLDFSVINRGGSTNSRNEAV